MIFYVRPAIHSSISHQMLFTNTQTPSHAPAKIQITSYTPPQSYASLFKPHSHKDLYKFPQILPRGSASSSSRSPPPSINISSSSVPPLSVLPLPLPNSSSLSLAGVAFPPCCF